MTNPNLQAVKALKRATEAFVNAFEILAASMTAQATCPQPGQEPEPAPEPVPEPDEATTRTQVKTEEGATLEQIREVLSTLSREGRASEARAFLKKLGYTKLTDIPESLYDQVLPLARELLHD